jgi:hypothetical protein
VRRSERSSGCGRNGTEENHPEKVKERNDAHYYKNRHEIRAQQNERNAQLRLARRAAAGASNGSSSVAGAASNSGPHFGVLPGCRGIVQPGDVLGLPVAALRAGRHPVRQMCNEAYVIEAQEEKPLPVDAQEEAAFRARLAASLCAEGCRVLETDLRKPTCEFWGTCRRCHAVEHRKRDLFSAHGGLLRRAPRRGGREPPAGAREVEGVAGLLEQQLRLRAAGGGGAARGDHAGAGGADHGAELRWVEYFEAVVLVRAVSLCVSQLKWPMIYHSNSQSYTFVLVVVLHDIPMETNHMKPVITCHL